MLCAREHRSEGDVELKAMRLQLVPGISCFRNALLGQARILPAREQVFQIPFALAVTHEHEKTIAHFTSPACPDQSLRSDRIGTEPLASCFDAFSSREPVPTSLENALISRDAEHIEHRIEPGVFA